MLTLTFSSNDEFSKFLIKDKIAFEATHLAFQSLFSADNEDLENPDPQ